MTLVWLVWWAIQETPAVGIVAAWNEWGVGLLVCLAMDVIATVTWFARRRQRPYFHAFNKTYVSGKGWMDGEPDEARDA